MWSELRRQLRRRAQFLIYLAGGVLSALIDIGLMQGLIHQGVPTLLATSAGFGAGLLFNYAFHARVTFQAQAGTRSFGRYLCIVLMNYLLTLGLVALAQAVLGSPLAGKLASLPVVALNGYLLGKYWIFRAA